MRYSSCLLHICLNRDLRRPHWPGGDEAAEIATDFALEKVGLPQADVDIVNVLERRAALVQMRLARAAIAA